MKHTCSTSKKREKQNSKIYMMHKWLIAVNICSSITQDPQLPHRESFRTVRMVAQNSLASALCWFWSSSNHMRLNIHALSPNVNTHLLHQKGHSASTQQQQQSPEDGQRLMTASWNQTFLLLTKIKFAKRKKKKQGRKRLLSLLLDSTATNGWLKLAVKTLLLPAASLLTLLLPQVDSSNQQLKPHSATLLPGENSARRGHTITN